jgi:two-component system, sensor histidine kinase YesM
LIIEDTGIGMTQEKADSLLCEQQDRADDNTYHTNLGIYAVNKRIKYLYGDQYGVEIRSEVGEGTCVRIFIPYMDDPTKLYKKYHDMMGEECDDSGHVGR